MTAAAQTRESADFERRMLEVGAPPNLLLSNKSGSVLLAHTEFSDFEGVYAPSPYLMLTLCTARTGRFRRAADNACVEGVLRPGTLGLALPNTAAEGYWPKAAMLGVAIDLQQHQALADGDDIVDRLAAAGSALHRDPLLSSVMNSLWRDAEAHGLGSAFFDHGIALLLKRLEEFEGAKLPQRLTHPLVGPRLKRALEFIEERIEADMSLDEFALVVGRDPRTATRAFRSATGYAPYEYLTLRRMEQAKQLLRSGSRVIDVALAVGYANPSKFSAAFRRFFGCSPAAWRHDHAD